MYIGPKKKEKFRHWGMVVECTIMGLGLCTILLAVLIFCNADKMLRWLPLMFLLAALVNVISSVKALYYGRYWAVSCVCRNSGICGGKLYHTLDIEYGLWK